MKTIGITGSQGLLGWHLKTYLYSKGIPFNSGDRKTFSNKKDLSEFVKQSDVIVHLAGMNRGDEKEITETNIALVKSLVAACEEEKRSPFVIFSSSTQIYKDRSYGKSKKECTGYFAKWAEKTGAGFCNLILPNVFGECGKPFYNSVVSTFCHQLANNLEPKIHIDQEIELIHAQKVAGCILNIINNGQIGDVLVKGTPITVKTLLQKVRDLSEHYKQGLIPKLESPFDMDLFNTYRSYLFPKQYPVSLVNHKDERGFLFEAVKSLDGGLTFVSHTKPGVTRGDHYHLQKIERFLVISGKARIRIRKLFSDEVTDFDVNGRLPQYIDIPTLYTHNISNIGNEDLVTLFWSYGIFDPDNPDTFKEKVKVE